MLLEAGANVNAVDSRSTSGKSSRNTALTIAAKHGFRKCVKLLLKKGADVNKSNSYGTALIIAAGRGHVKCVEVLLKKGGASVDLSGVGGYTALMRAAENGHFYIMDCLLKSGASVNKESFSNGTALMHAARNGHHACVEMLIQSGAAVEKTPYRKHSALTEAATHEKCLKVIVKTGTRHAKISGQYGCLALRRAASAGRAECIELLLDAKVNKDEAIKAAIKRNKRRQKALNTALLLVCDSPRVLSLLIGAGADVNYRDRTRGCSALKRAVHKGWTEHVQILTEEEAEVNIVDFNGKTPFYPAVRSFSTQIVQLLLKKGIYVNTWKKEKWFGGERRFGDDYPSRKMCMLLFAAGEMFGLTYSAYAELGKRNYALLERLQKRSNLELKDICRQAIRRHLLRVNRLENLFVRIPNLEIPVTLHEYLLYHVSLDDPNVIERTNAEEDEKKNDDGDDDTDDDNGVSIYNAGAHDLESSGLSDFDEDSFELSDSQSDDNGDSDDNNNNDASDDDDDDVDNSQSVGVDVYTADMAHDLDDDFYYFDIQFSRENFPLRNPVQDDESDASEYDYGDDDDDDNHDDYGDHQDYDDVAFDGDDDHY